MSERRADTRRRTLLSGRLCAESTDAPGAFDCIVLDMSEGGARLICRSLGIDGEVVLHLKAARGFKRRGRIAWRRVEDCGVQFIEPRPDETSEPKSSLGPHGARQLRSARPSQPSLKRRFGRRRRL